MMINRNGTRKVNNTRKVKKALSSDTTTSLSNYNNVTYNHQKKQTYDNTLLNHQDLFNFEIDEDEYVSNLYKDSDMLMKKLEAMIFKHDSMINLKKSYFKLKKSNKLKFGTHNHNSLGFVRYEQNNVQNASIYITTDQSILGVATTLVHELQHFYDLYHISRQKNQSVDRFTLELDAFAKEYQFLADGMYLNDTSYISLHPLAKKVFINAYKLKNSATKELCQIEFMSNLFEQIGYNKDTQFIKIIISSKDVELAKMLHDSHLHKIAFLAKVVCILR